MADTSEVVDIVISASPAPVSQEGFGVGLALYAHLADTARYLVFSSLAAVGSKFGSTSKVYAAAALYFGQDPKPKQLAVGRRQVNTATIVVVTATNGATYTVTINGVAIATVYSDSTPTVAEAAAAIRAAIAASVDPLVSVLTVSGSGANIILTHSVPGTAWTLSVTGTTMTISTLVAAAGADDVSTDLDAVVLENKGFYAVMLIDRTSAAMQDAAAWVQGNKRILAAASQETSSINLSLATELATPTSLPGILHAAGYRRTAPVFSEAADTSFPDAALLGRILPYKPGSYTAFLKPLTGITVSPLTDTQSQNARAKKCNVYEEIGGSGRLREGTMADGTFIDEVHGQDWLESRMRTEVFSVIASVAKVPQTDNGISLIENAMRVALNEGVDSGFLASYTISAPKIANVSPTDKANRLLPDVPFDAIKAAAFHHVGITGVIRV